MREDDEKSSIRCAIIKIKVVFFTFFIVSVGGCEVASVVCHRRGSTQNKTTHETITDKKLRYREEHSASVVLSWCTL